MKTRTMLLKVIFLLTFILITPQVVISNTQIPLFFQPYSLLYNYNDFHVMLYFLDHPEYEAVEAMIEVKNQKSPVIRAIITRHDKTQVDYINHKDIVGKIKEQKIDRETHYTEIIYKKTIIGGESSILLKFTTIKNERIIFNFKAVDKVSPKYAGLTDPERHSIDSSLPIMYREQSTLAHPDSKITFNDKVFKIPVKVHVPIFFKGMKGYYSEGFSLGIIRSDVKELVLIKLPKQLSVGEQWIYKSNDNIIKFRIVSKTDNQFLIMRGNELIDAEILNGAFQIKKISVQPNLKNRGLHIEFSPSLPLLPLKFKQSPDIQFQISIDNHDSLVTGVIKTTNSEVIMIPKDPEWATKRIVHNTIKRKEDKILIKTIIGVR